MFKMYLEDIKLDNEELPGVLIFSNDKDGGKMNIPVSESIGFDLRILLNQKIQGMEPYFGICELVDKIGGKIEKLLIRSSHRHGSAGIILNIDGKSKEIELFFADVVSICIVLNLPIYFDEEICARRDTLLADRLMWTRTESLTNYSFDTGN